MLPHRDAICSPPAMAAQVDVGAPCAWIPASFPLPLKSSSPAVLICREAEGIPQLLQSLRWTELHSMQALPLGAYTESKITK